jgi:hypothetical protein
MEIDMKKQKLEEMDASKRFYIRNFLEVMDRVITDPIEKQVIRTTFLDVFNKHHRFIESIMGGTDGKGKDRNKSRQQKFEAQVEKNQNGVE